MVVLLLLRGQILTLERQCGVPGEPAYYYLHCARLS